LPKTAIAPNAAPEAIQRKVPEERTAGILSEPIINSNSDY
jgi:hypothetical protein